MSREIDERIVQMKFESGQFEKNVQTSIHSLDELKKGLDFKDATKGLEGIDKATKGLKFDGLTAGIEALNNRFTLLGITGLNVMNRIANAAIDTGERMVKSLSTDQITAGWSKYGDKTSAVQTIMSATAKQFTDTGEQMEYVNSQLDKLNWFTDETSYNFLEMVNNIGKFTSNNISLDQSVTSMQGIATWAAQAGANANEASRAMYNLSQAISVGSVKLIDWKSIENANMATASFKEQVLEAAAAEGTLIKQGDKFVTANKKSEVSISNFNEALSEGWFTSKVLLNVLDKYGAAANRLNEIVDQTGVTTSVLIGYIDDYSEGNADLEKISASLGLTLEETTSIMEEFQDETMQFGLKAFKAAQEAKTFKEAIDSVKDAVSSGWMQTFEYIFGDYEKAKELWTDVANILYDLFAESGNQRNALLEEWSEWGGREILLAGFYNILNAILKVMAAIKKAWRSVFPPQTAENLLLLTESFYLFTEKLILSEDTLKTLSKAFRGLFLIVDTVRFILINAAKTGFSVLQRVLAELNIDLSGFVSRFTSGAEALNKYVKTQTWATTAFEKLGDILVAGIRKMKEFIAVIKNLGPVRAIINAFNQTFTSDFNGITSILTFVGNVFSNFLTLISETPFPKGLSDIKDFFISFGQMVGEEFSKVGIDFSAFEKLLNIGWTGLISVIQSFISIVGVAGKSVGTAFASIREQMKGIDWSGVALLAMGVAIVAMIYKIADAITAVSKSLLAFTNIGTSVQGVLGGVKKVLESTAKVVDATKWVLYGATMVEVAFAFGLLAAALIALSKVPADDLEHVSFYLGLLGITLSGFVYLLGSVGSVPQVSGVLVAFALAIATFVYSMNALDVSNTQDVINKMLVIESMLLAFVFAAYLMGKYAEPIKVGTASLIGIVASLYLMMNLLKSIGKEDPKELMMAFTISSVMMLVLAGISRLLTTVQVLEKDQKVKKSGGTLKLIGMLISLLLLVSVLKKFGSMDGATLLKGVLNLIPVITALGLLFKMAQKVSKNAAGAGPLLLGAAAALYILVGVIKNLADIPIGDIVKGGLVIIAIEKFAFAPLVEAAKYSGKNAGKVALLLLGMAGALAIIQMVVKTLGAMNPSELLRGVAATSILIYSFVPMISALKSKGNIEVTKQLTKMIVAIGLLGTIVFILSKFTDLTKTLAAAASLSAVMLAMAESIKIISKIRTPKTKTFLALVGIVGMLGTVMAILNFATTNPTAAIANATAISAVMIALSASLKLMPKLTAAEAKNLKTAVSSMLGIITLIGLVIAGLGLVSKYADPTTTIALAASMGGVLVAIAYTMKLIPNYTAAQAKNLEAAVTSMTTFIALVGGLMIAFGLVSKYADPVSTLALAGGMSAILLAVAGSMKLMEKMKVPNTSELVKMGAFVTAIGLVLAGLAYLTRDYNPVSLIATATAISELLLALGVSIRLMNNTKIDASVIGVAAIMIGFLTVAAVVIGMLSSMTNPEEVLPIATALSLTMLAMAGVIAILAVIPTPDIGTAINAIGSMTILVGGMALLMYALGQLVNGADAIAVLQNGGEVLKQIGIAIGNFVGGIIGGIIGGAAEGIIGSFPNICQSLSDGVANLLPMFDNLQKIPGGALELIGTVVGMIAAITAAEFISGLGQIPFIGGLIKSGSETMAEDFAEFGEALNAFSESIGDVNAYKVKAAAEAIAALASVQGDMKDGGLMGLLFGSGSDAFDSFVNNIPKLGLGLKMFAIATEGIDKKSVEGAVAAADMLVALEKSVSPVGGLLNSELFGEHDIGAFGERIASFARSLVVFGSIISGQNGGYGLNQGAVDAAHSAGQLLIELENSLPPNGGMIQDLFLGNKDLAGFGQRLKIFAQGLVDFGASAAGMDMDGIEDAVTASRKLIELESGITTADNGLWGKLFGGEGTFSSFGKNLIDLGEGLRQLGSKASVTDFDGIQRIIDVITTLGDVGDVEKAIQSLVGKVGEMVTSIRTTIQNAYQPTLLDAKQLGEHIVTGITIGLNNKKKDATTAIGKLAQDLLKKFRDELGIHSPSTEGIEAGEYFDEGVAQGIEQNTSAEDAATAKAKAIVATVRSVFENSDLLVNLGNVKYENWQLTEGRGANWQATLERELENKMTELAVTGEKVKEAYAKWVKLQQKGGNAKDIMQAEIDYIELSNSYQKLRNEIIDNQIESAESMIEELDLLDQVRQAEYDRWASSKEGKNASAVEKTTKEMELLVSQLETVSNSTAILWSKHKEIVKEFGEDSTEARNAYIKALNSEQKLNETYDSIMEKQQGSFDSIREARDAAMRSYSDFMNDIAPKLMEMGFTLEQVQEQAKQESKWDYAWGDSLGGGFSVGDINEIMDKAHEDISLVKGELVSAIGEETVEGVTTKLVEGLPLAVSAASPGAKKAGKQVGEDIGQSTADEVLKVLEKELPSGVKTIVGHAIQGGVDAWNKGGNIWESAARSDVFQTLAGMSDEAEENSPSKATYRIANYMVQGFANAFAQNGSDMVNAGTDAVENTIDGMTTLTQNLSSYLQDDLNLDPVITPVLNLDEIATGKKKLDEMLTTSNGLDISSIDIRANKVAASLRGTGTIPDETGTDTHGSINYNFTQNNYSPKALSRYDIYRQTRNQFSQLKGATSK